MNIFVKSMTTFVAISALTFPLLYSQSAMAHKGHDYREGHKYYHYDDDWHHHYKKKGKKKRARVVHVEPIYQRYSVFKPHKHCKAYPKYRDQHHHWKHGKRYYGQSYNINHSNSVDTVVGSVVGGIIGNQFGSGSGNTAATIAGAAIGGVIANDLNNYQGARHGLNQRIKHHRSYCDHKGGYYKQKRRIIGYDVTYRHRGKLYNTHLSYHPGKFIRIK